MVDFDCACLTVRWDAKEGCDVMEWKGYREGAELRAAMDKVLELLTLKNGSAIFSDARRMKAWAQEDQRWVVADWTPRARVVGLRKTAILIPQSAISRMSIDQMNRGAAPTRGDAMETVYFDDRYAALWWLRS